MAFEQRSLSDYIDVAERIADFREKYPEGCLRPWNRDEPYKFIQAMGWEKDGTQVMQSFVVVVAAAHRHPLDESPGIGMAWEIFPGRTPYTRGSELQNAETSAWGRAIIAVGASDSKRGIASREEVRNRQAEREDGLPVNADGSLSRSRTSDDQKAAAGVMTGPDLRAHNALRRDGEPDPQRVEKLSTTPRNDPFYTTGISEGDCPTCGVHLPQHGVGCPEVRPAPVRTKPAGWLLSERFKALGVMDRNERLLQCGEIIGRPISSSSELEPGEVAAILEALQQRELAR